jgi:membrane-associated protease RseP (regulator of RpoE activity)
MTDPFFQQVIPMNRGLLLLVTSMLLLLGQAFGADVTYRVSGIVGQENNWIFAVIEDSLGGCRVYAKGDMLGSAQVVDVTPQGVLIKTAGDVSLLPLAGSSFVAKGTVTDGVVGVQQNIGSTRPVRSHLSAEELKYALNNVADELSRDKKKALEPQILNALLGLPAQTQIVAVNEQKITTMREALSLMQVAVNDSKPLDFIVADGEVVTKIYYTPSLSAVAHPHE